MMVCTTTVVLRFLWALKRCRFGLFWWVFVVV